MAGEPTGGGVPPAFTVGEVLGQVVTDGGFGYVPGFLFANAPEAQLHDELAGRLTEDGKLWTPYDCVLLRTPTQTVLIDGGGGSEWSSSTGLLLSSLAAVGVQP